MKSQQHRSDAVLIKPVSFHRREGEAPADRHARRAAEVFERMAEVERVAHEIGVLDLSREKWVRLELAEAEVLWSPAEANLTARVRGVRIPSAHVLDVDSWAEQVRWIADTGGLDLRRARPYGVPVIVWREGDLALCRCLRKLAGIDWDEERQAYAGPDRLVWQALRATHANCTGVSPTRLFPIVGA